jgi:hypothetical protein
MPSVATIPPQIAPDMKIINPIIICWYPFPNCSSMLLMFPGGKFVTDYISMVVDEWM